MLHGNHPPRMTRTIRLAAVPPPSRTGVWVARRDVSGLPFPGALGLCVAGTELVGSSKDDHGLIHTRSRWLAWAASDVQATRPDNVELEPLSGLRCHEINPPGLLNPKNPDSCCT